MRSVQADVELKFLHKSRPPDPRTVERWERRLSVLSNPDGFVLHATLGLSNTRIFYVAEVRESVRGFFSKLLPSFVIKLEGEWQSSGYLFPHAHVVMPVLPEVRPFLVALKMSGATTPTVRYKGEVLPNPFSLLPDRGPTNVLEYLTSIPDLAALENLVNFRESTITTLRSSPSLARYLAKTTYRGGLSPVIEHGIR